MTAHRLLFLLIGTLPATSVVADNQPALSIQLSRPNHDSVEQKHEELQLSWPGTDQMTLRYAHDYRVFDLAAGNGVAAASNGHVHRMAVLLVSSHAAWVGEFGPVIATSSNALRQAKQLAADDLQWQAALSAIAVSNSHSEWRYGLRADSRLGRYRLYPAASWQGELSETWSLQIGWPDSKLNWRLADDIAMRWHLGPSGGQWQVHDEEFLASTELHYQQWQFDWQLDWSVAAATRVSLALVREFNQELRYRLLDERMIRVESPDSTASQVGITWTF